MTMTTTSFGPTAQGGRIRSWLGAALSTVMLAALSLFPNEAHAMKVQEVKSPGGINAWLVESNTVPLIAMRFAFDLWSHDDVSSHADAILGRLEAGTMPCDGAWPAERVAVFRQWIDAGKPA